MSEKPPAPIKPPVTVEDFSRLDIRVGRIEKVSDVPDSRKLVKLDVSFGDHRRTILAGLKDERKNPEEIAGLQAIFLVWNQKLQRSPNHFPTTNPTTNPTTFRRRVPKKGSEEELLCPTRGRTSMVFGTPTARSSRARSARQGFSG